MAQIIQFGPARAPARHNGPTAAPASSVVEMPGRYVRPLHRRHMAQAARDDGMMAALADEQPDPFRMLAETQRRVVVTWPAKLLVAAMWVVCIAYCVAIWLKVVP